MEGTATWPIEFSGLKGRRRDIEDFIGKCGLEIKHLTQERRVEGCLQRLLER